MIGQSMSMPTSLAAENSSRSTGVERAAVKTITRYSAVVVLVALAALSLTGFFIARRSLKDQEQRLLHERGSEVAALLTSSINGTAPTMALLGEVYNARRAGGVSFAAAATSLVKGSVIGVGVGE